MFPDSDPELDAMLRDVPLPRGMQDRLRAIAQPDDAALDELILGTPVPTNLIASLLEIPLSERLDQEVADVVVPASLLRKLRQVPIESQLARSKRNWTLRAVAAALFITLSATLWSTVGALVTARFPPPETPDADLVFVYDGPMNMLVETTSTLPTLESSVMLEVASPLAPARSREPQFTSVVEPQLAAPLEARPSVTTEVATLFTSKTSRMWQDVSILRQGVLGSADFIDDELAEVALPRWPVSRGIEPPIARGYDRSFFLKNRSFPPISPSSGPEHRELEPPLWLSSDGLLPVREKLLQGKLPRSEEVHVEDFLSAINYRFTPPSQGLAIRTAAGPSILGLAARGTSPRASSSLLLVGVQSANANVTAPRRHMILAIDVSSSMNRQGRMEQVKLAVRKFASQLRDGDLLSIVTFSEESSRLVERASAAEARDVSELLDIAAAGEGTNLAGGLQQSLALAMESTQRSLATSVIAITDSDGSWSQETANQLDTLAREAAAQKIQLDVALQSSSSAGRSKLVRLTATLGGEVHAIDSSRSLYALLVDKLLAADATVGNETRLRLEFNPKVVSAYRLIGHGATPLADVQASEVSAQMRVGETAVVLVELWLTPDQASAESDNLGQAHLSWLDPATGQPSQTTQRISRLQIAPSWNEASPQLQAAALSAALGELVRGVPQQLLTLKEGPLSPADPSDSGFAGSASADASSANTTVTTSSGDVPYSTLLRLARRSWPHQAGHREVVELADLLEQLAEKPPR